MHTMILNKLNTCRCLCTRQASLSAKVVLVLAVLSGCVSTPSPSSNEKSLVSQATLSNKPDSVIEPNQDQVQVVTAEELAQDDSLPKLELSAEVLELLLTMNFASFNGDWVLGADKSLRSAQLTRDFRLARLSTLLAIRAKNYEHASTASSLWLELKSDDIDAQNMNIIALVGASKIDLAKQAIEKQKQGQNIDDYIKQLAAMLIRQTNNEAGFEVIKSQVEAYPESAQVHVSAAYVADVFQKHESAESWVRRALELRSDWDLAAQMMVRALQAQQKEAQATEFIKEFVSNNPASVTMRISYAAELANNKEYVLAHDLMLAVLSDAPDDVGALTFTAALSQELGDATKAAYYYRRALDIEPNNHNVRWSAARLAHSQKKYITADRFYRDIGSGDRYFESQIQLANVRYETQGIDAALQVLSVLEPLTNDQYLNLAITRHYLLMREYRYEDALGYINDTLVFFPEDLDLLYARALVAAELNKLSIAEADLRQVIEASPNDANALNALGYTLADQTNRFEEAKELIAKALALRPNDAHILDSWGWVSYKLNDFETAIEYLKRAYDASPEAEVAAHLGEVLWVSGDQEEAISIWQEGFSEDPVNPVLNATLKKFSVDLKISNQ